MGSHTKRIVLTAVSALLVIGYALLLWRGPWWLDGSHLRERELQPADGVVITGFRTTLVALTAGAVAGFGLWYTHNNHTLSRRQFAQTQQQFRLAQEQFAHAQEQFRHTQEQDREQAALARAGQIKEHHVEAIKLLGSPHTMEQLGGIHVMARIMRTSQNDQEMAVEALCSYIRLQVPASRRATSEPANSCVQAAITVIGQRPHPIDELHKITLRDVNLSGISFDALNFDAADFSGSLMTNISTAGASFRRALFIKTDLSENFIESTDLAYATLTEAKLFGTTFWNSDLSETRLISTDLRGARFSSTDLTHATMHEANLSETILYEEMKKIGLPADQAEGLSVEMLSDAFIYQTTQLPPDMAARPEITARIAQCERSTAVR